MKILRLLLPLALMAAATLQAMAQNADCDPVASFPWSDDLEAYPGVTYGTPPNNLPDCWGHFNPGASNSYYPLLWSSASYAQSGSKSVRFYISSGDGYSDQTMLLPPMAGLSGKALSFSARCGSASHTANSRLAVGVVDNNGNYSWMDTVDITSIEYQFFEISLSAAPASAVRVAIRALKPTSGWSQVHVDDLGVATANNCPRPQGVAVTGATSTSLSLSWNGQGGSQWNVLVSDTAVVDFSAASPLSTYDTFLTVSGLTPSTEYFVYVQTDCGDAASAWTLPLAARTACTPIAASDMPYIYGFEDATASGATGQIDPCWTLRTNYTSAYPQPHLQAARTGTYGLYFMGYNSTNYSYAVLPPFASSIRHLSLTFWSRSRSASYSGTVQVGIITNPNDLSTFQPVATCTPNGADWTEHTVGFAAYEGTAGQIAIVMPAPTGYNYAYIDDIQVDTVACPQPALRVDSLGSDEMWVSWRPELEETDWSLEYRADGEQDWGYVSLTGNSYHIDGLEPETRYQLRVGYLCDTNMLYTSTFATTLALPDTTPDTLPAPTLCYPIDTLPYLMTFDDLGAPAVERTGLMPDCWAWRRLNTTPMQDSLPHLRYNPIYSASGSYTLCLPYLCLVTLPELGRDLELADLRLSFSDYVSSPANGLIVGVCDSNTAGCEASFTPFDTIFHPEAGRHDVTLYLAAYEGHGRYIAFRNHHATQNYSYHYLDNILLEEAPGCLPVQNLREVDNTETSVTLAWQELRHALAWEVALELNPDSLPAGDTVVLHNPARIEGLTAGTEYFLWVRSICDAGDTGAWVGPLSVTPGSHRMRANQSDTLRLCSGLIFDDGGRSGDYSANQSSTLVLIPSEEGSVLQISGSCHIEPADEYATDPDMLYLYEGIGTGGTLLGSWSGNASIPLTLSTIGPLTLRFVADYMIQDAGFELTVSCTTITCPVVEQLLASNISATSATISWVPQGTESEWEVECGPFHQTMQQTSLSLSNLTPGTDYTARVRPLCGEGDNGYWRTVLFTTECAVVADYPWSDNLNSYRGTDYGTAGPLPNCWLAHSNGTSPDYMPHIVNAGNYHFSPDNSPSLVMTAGSSAYGSVKYVALPEFSHPIEQLRLTFWYQTEDLRHGTLTAGYFTTDDLPSSFTPVADLPLDSLGRFDTLTFDTLSVVVPARLGFRWTYPTSFYSVCLDNLGVDTLYVPHCDAPAVDSLSLLTHQGATLHWSGQGERFQLALTTEGEEWPEPITVEGNSYELTDLQPATEYFFRLRQDCTADSIGFSPWSSGSFTTPQRPCHVPVGLEARFVSGNYAELLWHPGGDEEFWQLRYWAQGDTVSIGLNDSVAAIADLFPAVTYSAQVRALCGVGNHSDWSDTIRFTTLACEAVSDIVASDVSAHGATISWTPHGSASRWKVSVGEEGHLMDLAPYEIVYEPTYTVSGLTPDQRYDVLVQAICGDQWLSETVRGGNFRTSTEGIPTTHHSPLITIYPNPASTQVTIAGYEGEVIIVDLTGRVVLKQLITHHSSLITLEALPQGTYFVKLGTAVQKLIIQ